MKVYFENLEFGWVDFKIFHEGKWLIQDRVSYTPYNSFLDLIDTVHLLHTNISEMERRVIFNTEPIEYEFYFYKKDDAISLKINMHKNHRRTNNFTSICSFEGDYDEICIPFWRALRRLQGNYTSEDLTRRWHRPFPSMDLDKLTDFLKGKNA